ncbi:MAG: MerR family transcriptional regulator [Micrococcales bacterium]|nr:MAG: MerR family transcriptional regulator [Micrococcales bacterium]PIE26618.1 MAG: MerR family transcriptional regulator [Micrococcales bacterium]
MADVTKTRADDVSLTVGQVAAQFGVTVRTLHHYDDIGLLVPGDRSGAGYRLYSRSDVTRLAEIVALRRLGLSLTQVEVALNDPQQRGTLLWARRAEVTSHIQRLHRLVDAIDRTLEVDMSSRPATTQELREIFGEGFDESYHDEARQRWGETDEWKQSQQRTARYTKDDWEQIKAETEAINADFVAALADGAPAGSERAMDVAQRHRAQIHERFYDVDADMHRCLADMYVSDPRFTRTYEDLAPGLAQYVHDAIHANADRTAPNRGTS